MADAVLIVVGDDNVHDVFVVESEDGGGSECGNYNQDCIPHTFDIE